MVHCIFLYLAEFDFFNTAIAAYKALQNSNPQPTSLGIPDQCPLWRFPDGRQLLNFVPSAKRRGRLARKPFEALSLLAERNPEKVIK
jgi:hypothetical protein